MDRKVTPVNVVDPVEERSDVAFYIIIQIHIKITP